MIYGEMEVLGIADVPHISTMFYLNTTKWIQWKIRINDENLEIQAEDSITEIPLKDIIFVDRSLSQAIINKIQNTSRHGAVIIIDYKKEASIGVGEVIFTTVLAGKKTDISNLKYLLMSLLGMKVDPLVGSMRAEEIRLLCLLASGVNKTDMLIPIFDGDEDLLYRTFAAVKAKELVDEYTVLTPLGVELVNKVKGIEKKKIGSDIITKFDELRKVWDYLDKLSLDCHTNKLLWKSGSSTLCGNVSTVDVIKYLPLKNISEMKIEMCDNCCGMGLVINTANDTSILLKSHDYSIIVAFYGLLSRDEDIQIRILFFFYVGYTAEKDILDILQINSFEYERHYRQLVFKELVDEQVMELTSEGLNLIYKKIIGDVSVLLEHEPLEYNSDNFKRFEQIKMASAKRRVLATLQEKHSQVDA
ncbi:hypothetical protein Mpsy_0894 [Methanolobus psychrophilus R15]|nr:hypothetical protein Mpsy_0894 [Methanolobus psychrophilus R15]